MKCLRIFLTCFCIFLLSCSFVLCSVSAQTYTSDFPAYAPVSGGAFIEAQTSQGRICVIVPINYQDDTFGFSGNGYNVANVTNSTVSGYAYKNGSFSYYGNPTSVQARFTSMSTLQVYEPYQTNYGTSYRWIDLPITQIYNTNIGLMDDKADRQNNDYVFDYLEKMAMVIIVALVGLIFVNLLRGFWRA